MEDNVWRHTVIPHQRSRFSQIMGMRPYKRTRFDEGLTDRAGYTRQTA
jgi:hypothetical protein